MRGIKFSTYGVPILRKRIESMRSYSRPSHPLKTSGKILCKSVSPKTEGDGGSYAEFVRGFQHPLL